MIVVWGGTRCHLLCWDINGVGGDEEGYRAYMIKDFLGEAKEFGFHSKMKNF